MSSPLYFDRSIAPPTEFSPANGRRKFIPSTPLVRAAGGASLAHDICASWHSTVCREGEDMAIGTVKWFNSIKGYGFIEPEGGGKDAFVHISAVERAGISSLNEGQRVEFDLTPGQDGKSSAENLKLID